MGRIRTVGLCLLAMFALGAIIASVAQAEGPEWGRCKAQKGGKYTRQLPDESRIEGKQEDARSHYKASMNRVSLVEEEKVHSEPYCEAKKKSKYTNATCTERSGKVNKKTTSSNPTKRGRTKNTGRTSLVPASQAC